VGLALHPCTDYVLSASSDKSWAFSNLVTGRVLTTVVDAAVTSPLSCIQVCCPVHPATCLDDAPQLGVGLVRWPGVVSWPGAPRRYPCGHWQRRRHHPHLGRQGGTIAAVQLHVGLNHGCLVCAALVSDLRAVVRLYARAYVSLVCCIAQKQANVAAFSDNKARANTLAFSENGYYVASGTEDGVVNVGQYARRLCGVDCTRWLIVWLCSSCACWQHVSSSLLSRSLCTCRACLSPQVWDLRKIEHVTALSLGGKAVSSLAFDLSGSYLAAGSDPVIGYGLVFSKSVGVSAVVGCSCVCSVSSVFVVLRAPCMCGLPVPLRYRCYLCTRVRVCVGVAASSTRPSGSRWSLCQPTLRR
jgi:hypothetical protein